MTINNDNGILVHEGKNMAMLVCWVLGTGSLVAWNSMICIGDYYYELFPNYHPSRVLTLVYQPFAVVTVAVMAYHEAKIGTRKRILFGYSLFFFSTLLLIVVDLVSSGKGGVAPYVGICVLVAAFGVAIGHVQGGMVGELAFMLPEFMQAFMAGLAAAGVLTSCLRLVTRAAFEKTVHGFRYGALLFLAISAFIEFICIFLYAHLFPKLPIVKHFRKKAAAEGSKTATTDHADVCLEAQSDQAVAEPISKTLLFKQNLDYCIGLYLLYVITLFIFPGFFFENTGEHELGTWYPLVLMTMFNLLDLIGRCLPLAKCLRIESRKVLVVAILSRLSFIPAFYFTAKYADQGWMIMLTSLLGLTHGHLTVCILIAAPKGYNKGHEQKALGNILAVMHLGGIFSGVSLDWLWLIGHSSF